MTFGLFGVVSNAEAGLFRAFSLAGGPTDARRQSCWWHELEQVVSCLPR